MIVLRQCEDLDWDTVLAIAYDAARLELADSALAVVEEGRRLFETLVEDGVPCYGVTTGLGRLVDVALSEAERDDLPRNILRARAAAIGEPLPKEVVRGTMLLRLVNFLSGRDGVSAALCRFVVDRLNDDFVPWIPGLGHGMAADAIANTHCFQTFIGEGYVMDRDGRRASAAEALRRRGVSPYEPGRKEGLALINGLAAGPAYAIHAHRAVSRCLDVANQVACASVEAIAAPKDAMDLALLEITREPGVAETIKLLNRYLDGSRVEVAKLQAPVSMRVIPQVHGALLDAVESLKTRIINTFSAFTDNPVLVKDSGSAGRFLSNGAFHNQHLVNQAEQVALGLAHVGALSERRLHRLLDPQQTGLNAQLAARPGLDAGLVVAHKASIDLAARLKMLAQPVSLLTAETSQGQEDYMSMLFPVLQRTLQMCELLNALLAYELHAALVALDLRGENAGHGVERLRRVVREHVPALERDRPPGPDVEVILDLLRAGRLDQEP